MCGEEVCGWVGEVGVRIRVADTTGHVCMTFCSNRFQFSLVAYVTTVDQRDAVRAANGDAKRREDKKYITL